MLTEEHYEKLEEVMKITNLIWNSYCELGRLEKEGRKGTKDYNDILEELKIQKSWETEFYNNLNVDVQTIREMIERLTSHSMTSDQDLIELILDDSDLVLERVINNLSDLLPTNCILNVSHEALNDIMEHLSTSVIPEIYGIREMKKSFFQDFYACFLSIANKSNRQISSFQDSMIMMKYRLAFLRKDIEKYLFRSGFEIPNQVYLNTHCTGQLNGQSDDYISHFKFELSKQIIGEETTFLLAHNDESFLANKLEMLQHLFLLRAALLFLSDDEVLLLNDVFHMYIESSEYVKKNYKNSIAEMEIGRAYQLHKTDIAIPISVQFIKR